MKFMKKLDDWWENMVHPAAADKILDNQSAEADKALAEIRDADKVIAEHRYLKHMALWKLHAIEEYNHGRIRESANASNV